MTTQLKLGVREEKIQKVLFIHLCILLSVCLSVSYFQCVAVIQLV